MADKKLLKDFVSWDVVNWSKALHFWEDSVDLSNKNYRCLELGGREGGLSLWLALRGNEVICSDLTNPEAYAKTLHQKYNCRDRITYEAIDATNIPYENHFDIIVFKSILGGISRDDKSHLNDVVINQIFKALKPAGKVLFAENLKASKFHQQLRRKLVPWGGSWNYITVGQLSSLFKRYKTLNYDTAGFTGAFGRSEQQRNILGEIDTLLFDRIMSPNLKYIVFGVASKP